jgi:hypothetical protein
MRHKIGWCLQKIRIKTEVFFLRLFRYIDKDYEPIKCTCGCKDLEECNQDYLDGRILLEYDCRCKRCGKILNHWAYGRWEIW